MINSATKYCERQPDDQPSSRGSQKISASAVTVITLLRNTRLWDRGNRVRG
jgi:hypothetical protein